ncbi:dihydrofolate reductase [Streptomyces sp. YC504]|uniref:Dihydrofolate reductase n=1 Tax=Streptomyces mesophilus TaxID=1775132 RepID=A0A6G4XN79_9ACTN|nr:dihydrofolate reductase family protein [Streptomyces mesophilus]NGO79039.1 dihydrofolate reductase [Streptomyces mesophilus]
MGKIVALTYVSLDGVMENPSWAGAYFDSDHAKYAHGQLFAADALLLGRTTYEAMAAAWPLMEESEGGFAVRMNALPKHVVSTTLEQGEWNATVVRGDLAAEIAKVKDRYAGDILLYASGRLQNSLIALGLIDELKLWIHPVVAGKGKRLFPEGTPGTSWTLAGTTSFSTGAVVLDLRPAARP